MTSTISFTDLLAARQRTSPAQRRQGRAAVLGGARAESQVDIACEVLARMGRACVSKRPTPTTQVGPVHGDGTFPARRTAAAGVDYAGVLQGGRAVYFDVKSASGASLPLYAHGTPTVRPAQRAELDAVDALGGLAGLLVCVRPKPRGQRAVARWWWVPWRAWRDGEAALEQAGRKSVSVADLDAWGVECPRLAGAVPDWHAAALESETRSGER